MTINITLDKEHAMLLALVLSALNENRREPVCVSETCALIFEEALRQLAPLEPIAIH